MKSSQSTSLTLFLRLTLGVVVGCASESPVAPPSVTGNHAPPGPSTPAGPVTPVGALGRGNGPGGNNPADFPTIMAINFQAFPTLPGACTGARLLHVATGGNDGSAGTSAAPFRTIGRALEVAQSGDAVLVRGGTYVEGVSGDHRAIVIDRADISLCAVPGDSVVVRPASRITYGVEISASNVRIDGINLTGFSSSLIQLGNGAPLRQVVLQNMTLTAAGTGGRDGIATYNSQVDGLLISNVTVRDTYIGITCSNGPCRNWRLDRVSVFNDPTFGDTGQDAIAIENGDNFLLSNIEVTGAAGDGLDFKGSNVAVFNANVHDNRRNGVKFWRGGDLVNSFVVQHGADAAIVFEHGATYRILNSLVAFENYPAGGSYTVSVGYDQPTEGGSLAIINSIFYRNAGAIWVSPSVQVTLRNNLFGQTVEGEIMVRGNATVVNADPFTALAQIGSATGHLAFGTDPMFEDPSKGKFGFPANSPLTDAGVSVASFPVYDFSGQSRVRGRSVDLGPVERN